jgi:hypothetical protein
MPIYLARILLGRHEHCQRPSLARKPPQPVPPSPGPPKTRLPNGASPPRHRLGRETSPASVVVPGERRERVSFPIAKSRAHPLSDVRSIQGVSAGEGRHPALQPSGFIFTRIVLLEWQGVPLCRQCKLWGSRHRTIPRSCSWFLSILASRAGGLRGVVGSGSTWYVCGVWAPSPKPGS